MHETARLIDIVYFFSKTVDFQPEGRKWIKELLFLNWILC